MREKAAAQRKEEVSVAPMVFGKQYQLGAPCAKIPESMDSTMKLSKPSPTPRSPLETYEISDREDSDTDDSDESGDEGRKQKKKVCVWEIWLGVVNLVITNLLL